uniref:Uncharacterized protein n=1 Tax=Syphacia muris TaxID=451379 RepID=A0A158R5C9_9BILA
MERFKPETHSSYYCNYCYCYFSNCKFVSASSNCATGQRMQYSRTVI